MTTKITALKVLTIVRNAQKGKGKVTDIIITIPGGLTVARATLAGRWSEEQALAEYKRLPGRFKTEEEGLRVARAMRLAA